MKTIRIFQPLAARPARVYKALTDPVDLSAWHADVVRGRVQEGRTLELAWPKLGADLSLSVEKLVPGKLVRLSSPLGALELSVVAGGVELTHTAPFDEDALAGTESSWRVTLSILGNYLTRHVDRRRHVHWSVAEARASVELCHVYFSDARLLPSWLGTPEASIGPTNSTFNLALANGRRARGSVLSHTPSRDLALRWGETDDSVLVFRTLPSPNGPDLRLLLVGWSRWSELPDAPEICAELDRAVDRLRLRLESVARA